MIKAESDFLSMDEREIIRFIRSLQPADGFGHYVELGIGDDAACVRFSGETRAVLSTDMVIEGTHFTPDTLPEIVGAKAVARALSDLAAMAARPVCCLAAISFPPGKSDAYEKSLCRGIYDECLRLDAPLAGGDTSSGTEKLVITVTVVGTAGPGGLLKRSGAQPGDCICVTGSLGGSLAGRHLAPCPRITEAIELAETFDIHAMIDISDGLATDLLHIAEESKAGVLLKAEAIPVHPDAAATSQREGSGEKGAILHALNDGEDYELLFCLCEKEAMQAASDGIADLEISIIGKVTDDDSRVIIWPAGNTTELRDTGWRHLKKK